MGNNQSGNSHGNDQDPPPQSPNSADQRQVPSQNSIEDVSDNIDPDDDVTDGILASDQGDVNSTPGQASVSWRKFGTNVAEKHKSFEALSTNNNNSDRKSGTQSNVTLNGKSDSNLNDIKKHVQYTNNSSDLKSSSIKRKDGSEIDSNSEKTSNGINSKSRSSSKRNAVIMSDVGTLVEEEAIKHWIKKENDSLLSSMSITTDNSRRFCKNLNKYCKVIISPVSDNVCDQEILYDDNCEMVPKACQTEDVQVSLSCVDQRLKLVDKLQNELQKCREKAKSDAQHLDTVLSHLKSLQQENSGLKEQLQRQESKREITAQEVQESTNNDALSGQKSASPTATYIEEETVNSAAASITKITYNCSEMSSNQSKPEINDFDKDIVYTEKDNPLLKHTSSDLCNNNNKEWDEASKGELFESSSEEDLQVPSQQDLHISESEDEASKSDTGSDEDDDLEDFSFSASPDNRESGFSFDDIVKANLEYLSDENDLFHDKPLSQAGKAEGEIVEEDSSAESDSVENETSEDLTVSNNDDVPNPITSSDDKSEQGNIQDATKFWEDRFTSLARDKCVSDENRIHLDSESIGNIQKTKMLWEEKVEAGQNSDSPSSRKMSLNGDEDTGVNPNELYDEEIGNNVQQTKLRWQEMMSSSQNSNSSSPGKKVFEDANDSSSSGSENDDSSGISNRILQKKMLWEERTSNEANSANNDNESAAKRLTLDVLSEEDKADVNKAKMKFEEVIESRGSPVVPRRNIRLVSKTEDELEAEFISSDVMLQSISDVSNTKSKWEKMLTGEASEHVDKGKRSRNSPPKVVAKPENFVLLRDKFEGSSDNVGNQNTSSDC